MRLVSTVLAMGILRSYYILVTVEIKSSLELIYG